MHKQKLIDQAIKLLEEVNADDLDNIQINVCDYDDGSRGVTIDLTYPDGSKS